MKIIIVFTFLFSLAKAGLWISFGVLINKHMDTVISLFSRKPLPEDLINSERLDAADQVIKWIGIFIIIVGVGLAITSISTLIVSLNMSTNNFRFKF